MYALTLLGSILSHVRFSQLVDMADLTNGLGWTAPDSVSQRVQLYTPTPSPEALRILGVSRHISSYHHIL